MTCPSCNQPLTLGTSRVWVREDGTLAHVKCDPIPRPRRQRQARRQAAPTPVSRPAPVAPDERPVLVMWRRTDPFRYEVTDSTGIVWSGPSATALSAWKREHPEARLVNERDVAAAVGRWLAWFAADLTTITRYGNMKSSRRSQRRKEH